MELSDVMDPAGVLCMQAQLANKEAEYTHLAQEVHQYSAHHSIQELETLRTQVRVFNNARCLGLGPMHQLESVFQRSLSLGSC